MDDPKHIPEKSLIEIAAAIHGPMQQFYEDPENKNAYEKWAEERREKHEQANEA